MRNLLALLERLREINSENYHKSLWREDELLREYGTSLHDICEALAAARPELLHWLLRRQLAAIDDEWTLFIEETNYGCLGVLAVPERRVILWRGVKIPVDRRRHTRLSGIAEQLRLRARSRFRVDAVRRMRCCGPKDPRPWGFLFHKLP